MRSENLSRKTRSNKEDKQLIQAIILFLAMAVFVGFLLVVNF